MPIQTINSLVHIRFNASYFGFFLGVGGGRLTGRCLVVECYYFQSSSQPLSNIVENLHISAYRELGHNEHRIEPKTSLMGSQHSSHPLLVILSAVSFGIAIKIDRCR